MDELDRIDILRRRTGLGYAEAKALLDEAGGDVVEALIRYEKRQREEGRSWRWETSGRAAWRRCRSWSGKGWSPGSGSAGRVG